MYIINRSAIIVKLKQPYVDWTNSFNDEEKYSLDSLNRENHIYLISDYDTDEELEEIIMDLYPEIFTVELSAWVTDPKLWPKNRNYTIFKEWFEIEAHSMVFDPYEDTMGAEEV